VNDEGVAYRNYLADTSTEEYDEIMDTNVKGIFFCTKYAYLICLSVENVSVKNAGS
jgi:NAD(P)-dependent dehydrogenase (short-subunit alcohol dehydrogenase family)